MDSHTYRKQSDTVYTIGHWVAKPGLAREFVPLFDVGSRADALAAVGSMNGSTPHTEFVVTKDYVSAPPRRR